MPSVPLAISSQSRKKLRAFEHSAKQTTIADNKENDVIEAHFDPRAVQEFEDANTQDDVPDEMHFPQTPAVRIPIEDLIGNTEDAFNCPPPVTTPGDHVLWQNGPGSSGATASQNMTQKSRKRARSSSPASSQPERSSHFQAPRDIMNLNGIQQSLRTPNNDPNQTLWNRYMNANNSRTDEGRPVLLTFAHLLPSSPQTPSVESNDSGLRRTVSCGIEWPTSKPKRRKIDVGQGHTRTKNIFAASRREILAQDLPKSSRVGQMVEQMMQESLSKRAISEGGPSSSSPLPERFSQLLASPTRLAAKVVDAASTGAVAQHPANVPTERIQPTGQQDADSSSEFGDEDLDLEFFESVEQSLAQGVLQKSETQCVAFEPASDTRNLPEIAQKGTAVSLGNDAELKQPSVSSSADVARKARQPLVGHLSFDFDEFDDDDETFTAELEQLAAKYDSQDASGLTITKPVQESIASQRTGGPGDVFDDDDEDEDLWRDIANQTVDILPLAMESASQRIMDNRAIKRYLVVDALESHYITAHGQKRPEKMLSVKDERTAMLYIILLRQSWYDTRCTKGSYVHVIGEFDRTGQCIVDDADNMVILHPDHLISSTVVGDSFTCTRRAALQDRIKATSQATPPQVYGHILHEVFGEALRLDRWDSQSFAAIIHQILPNYLESLYEIGVSIPSAVEYLLGKTPELAAWASVFVGNTIVPDAAIRDRNGALVPVAINKLLELEEHVWSPMYGLKGNIDATVQAQMQLPGDPMSKTLVVPLELKTGKKDDVATHRAQTALYTLLLSDRYDVNVTCGVLYYMETSKTFRIEGVRNEIRHMIIQRNELACYVHDKLDLPPMIKRPHLCKGCYSKTQCFTYHKLIENGDAATSGVGQAFDEIVGHLKPFHQAFFKKWDDLLTKEERDSMKFRRELWTMISAERQAVGRCFSNVVIEPGSAHENTEATKINRFHYTFVKHKLEPSFSFTDSQITVGEPIVVSDERGHFNLAAGYVTNVRPTRVVVAVDRRLQNARQRGPGFDPERNQLFTGLMETALDGTPISSAACESQSPVLFRIDKDEFQNGMATARNNIIRIMEKDLFRARELRQLIIDSAPPSFKPASSAYTLSGPASQQSLNVDQRRAIEKVMSAKDYALVLGMPGTGKTTTIAHIIRALVSQQKSVLLASYTHTAVDNILLKIKDDNIPTLRIGAVSKVHPEVQAFADLTGVPKKSIEELHHSWHNSKVVATTCLGVTHSLFNARTFDYCIVDEASQITLPVCLGPIRMAKTFILVGDHYQLPPLVQNKEAQEGGLNVSLFKLLSEAHPDSVVNLEHQYRMAEDIMCLSKELVYDGRLKCGNESVASRTLSIPGVANGLMACHYDVTNFPKDNQPASICTADSSCWLRTVLLPQIRCVFLNTDTISPKESAGESVSGSRIMNAVESTLTAQVVTTLLRSGVSPRSIGVITFYRSQLALIKREVKTTAGTNACAEVEMHTADKYQGRDKEVVILSCVRSNDSRHVGELLKDWRRVNVAVTRARSKLIILGSKRTLGGSDVPILQGIVRIMNGKGWIQDLPGNATEAHLFESLPCTQTQAKSTNGRSGNNLGVAPPKQQPLHSTSGNASLAKKASSNFRMPSKIVRGKVDMDKLLDGRPVMKDVMSEIQ